MHVCEAGEDGLGLPRGGCDCFVPKGFAGAASDTLYYFPKWSLYFEMIFTV